jgi:drug/metabolite transporter (DMT)-like permease
MQHDMVNALAKTTPALLVEAKEVEVREVESRLPRSRRFGKQGPERRLTKSHFPARAIFALGVALVFWASAFAGIRAGLHAYAPAHLALFRYLIASGLLGVYARCAHFRRPEWRDVPGLVLAGSLGITVYNLALNYGEMRVTAGSASLLVSSTPIWAALLALFMLRERLTSLGWMGVLLSFAGVALIASGEGQGIHLVPQALIILAAALAWGMYIVIQKYFLGRYSALEFTSYSVWSGTLLLLPFGRGLVHAVQGAPVGGTLAVIYLGIFPAAIASFAWSYALSHGPAGRTSSFLYVIPVLATFIAWIWLGEVPRPLSLAGGAIAICGVVAVHVWGTVPATENRAAGQGGSGALCSGQVAVAGDELPVVSAVPYVCEEPQ